MSSYDPFSKKKPAPSERFNSLEDAMQRVSEIPETKRTRPGAFRPLTKAERERAAGLYKEKKDNAST
jgi:hypothetical protein